MSCLDPDADDALLGQSTRWRVGQQVPSDEVSTARLGRGGQEDDERRHLVLFPQQLDGRRGLRIVVGCVRDVQCLRSAMLAVTII